MACAIVWLGATMAGLWVVFASQEPWATAAGVSGFHGRGPFPSPASAAVIAGLIAILPMVLVVASHSNSHDGRRTRLAARDRAVRRSRQAETEARVVDAPSEMAVAEYRRSFERARRDRSDDGMTHELPAPLPATAPVSDLLQLETFHVAGLVGELVDTIAPFIQERQHTLTVHCAPDLGIMTADRMKTRRILLNVLGRAARSTTSGVISLAASRQSVSGKPCVEFRVGDTAEDAPCEPIGGAASALGIVSTLSRMMGGQVGVTHHADQGTSVTVYLPLIVVDSGRSFTPTADAA